MSRRPLLPVATLALVLAACSQPGDQGGREKGAAAKTEKDMAAQNRGDIPEIQFEKYTLPNGLQVILHVDRKLPMVHVNQWYHVGSKNERARRTGFAHLFEHLMFQGSKNSPGEYFAIAEELGANLREGGVNGTTSNDRTNYFATVPSANLERLLWLESDRLATLADAMTQAKLDNQREVVRNERRENLENQPYGRFWPLMLENVFPAGHPYDHSPIGSHEDLEAATLDHVKEFFRTYYTPNNLSLTIAGDFDPAEAKRLVEKYFGPIPPGPALDRPGRWVPVLTSEKVVEVKDRVPQERTIMVWPAPEFFGQDQHELDIASAILGDGLSSRLNKILVYDKQLCTEVAVYNYTLEISGLFVVDAMARPGEPLAEIERIVTAEIAGLAKNPPTQEEVDRAKVKREYAFVSGLEGIGGFGGKADLLNMYNTYRGDPAGFDEEIERYHAVTAAGVRAAVARWLDTPNRLLIHFRPETAEPAPVAELDRTQIPALGVDRPFNTPEVETANLDNGLAVFVIARPELPKVAVTLATRAGTVADPAGKDGVAHLTANTVMYGTRTRKSLDVETALGNLGTALSGSAQRELAVLRFEVLKRNLAPALEIFSDVVRNPAFPAEEVAREKNRQLDALAQENKDPFELAARIRGMLAFGPTHPYGRPMHGLPETIEQITREDLSAFHGTYWRPGSSALIFVGDVTLAAAVDLARKHLGGWSGGTAPAVSIPAPAPVGQGKIYIVDRPNAPQTVISQFVPAPRRKSEDYYALRLADAVWGGGGFGTRLNLNLRQDKGFTYGVGSMVVLFSETGIWRAGGGVQADKTRESLIEFAKEMRGLAGQKPITAEELAKARAVWIRGYAQQFETYGRVGSQVAGLWAIGLPMTELQHEPAAVEATTLEEVNAAARKYAVPAAATYLLVGDRAKIAAGVRELGLGDVVVVDEDGKLVASR